MKLSCLLITLSIFMKFGITLAITVNISEGMRQGGTQMFLQDTWNITARINLIRVYYF